MVPLIVYLFIPVAFADTNAATVDIIQRICMVLIILSLLFFAHAFMGAVYSVYSATGRYRNRPLKGMVQTVQVALWLVGIIVIIGQLTGQEVLSLLGGLGAMSAVLMLVFKDTIMGFVSGVQLSANNMLKVGDWIKMPKYGVDGTVTEVSLTTVKVRNWDNTVATLPPYMLVSEMFENWNAMRESGGRRVKRSINIDMNSVCFCTPEMLEEYRKIDLLKEYMSQEHEDPLTNLGVFRAYLVAWLRNRPVVNTDLHCMVRQLQPTEYGIPLELYFFSRIKDWVPYEGVQSDVFDYVLAVVPRFGLRVFQLPSGEDLQMLIGKKSQ